MIVKEYQGLDSSGRNRSFTESSCTVCTSIFVKQTRQLNEWGTCSIGCTSIAKGSSVECTCAYCAETFIKSLSKFNAVKSGKHFCSRLCKDTAQSYMIEIQPDHYGTGTGESTYRDRALKAYDHECQRCKYSSNIAALVVHHKDHNRDNNNITNLEVLCANCHTIHHWG